MFDVSASSLTNYYPFGMEQQDRSAASGTSRFAYNGMLKDNDIKGEGNSYTTEFRGMDPRIGRWWSLDPKPKAWESGYVSMGNNPIFNTDVKGDIVEPADKEAYEGVKSSVEEKYRGTMKFDDKTKRISLNLKQDDIDAILLNDPESNFAKFVELNNATDITNVKVVDGDKDEIPIKTGPGSTSYRTLNNMNPETVSWGKGKRSDLGLYLPVKEDYPTNKREYGESPDNKNHVYVKRGTQKDAKGKSHDVGSKIAHELYLHGYKDLKNQNSGHEIDKNNTEVDRIENNAHKKAPKKVQKNDANTIILK